MSRRRSADPEWLEKMLCLAALGISLELVLFKFLPDIATAVIQANTSTLADFKAFSDMYLVPGSVFHARFLGNYTLYYLAKFIGGHLSTADPRLHPLRIAAGILTPLYAFLGASLPMLDGRTYNWRTFLVPYALITIIGLYVFYPGDMPALASLSMGLYCLLRRQMAAALMLMLILGAFRETSFHMVWLICCWTISDKAHPPRPRMVWLATFAIAFIAEYMAIRRYFPGPLSSLGSLILDPREILLGKGIMSLTTLCSLSLAALFPIACWTLVKRIPAGNWRRKFFTLNCAVFPLWIVFYRMLNGNISEFRMLWPAILPCIYGISYATADPRRVLSSSSESPPNTLLG